MSTSRVINRWLNRVYKSIAILLVLFAVLISSLRLFLPYAHHYKENVENFINSANESHITIGELGMEWEKLGPSIVIKQVTLLETHVTDIFIDKIHVHIDFWQSLAKGRVITQDVTLEGAQFFIKSLDTSADIDHQDAPLVNRIADMFLDRIGRFSVLDSQVVLQTRETDKLLIINQLDWLNDGNRHRGKGYVIVDGLTSNNIKVLLDLYGDDIDNLDGDVYLQANQVNITPWLDSIFAIDDKDTHSAINFDGWLTIDNGFPTQLQIALGNNEISWIHNNTPQFFSVNKGHILTKINKAANNKDINGFNLFTSPLTFITAQGDWQPSSLQLSQTANTINAYISDLNVQGLTDISPLFTNNQTFTKLIENINPTGYVENVFLYNKDNNSTVTASFKELNSSPYNGIPGITHVSGELAFQNNALRLQLAAQQGALDFAEHFVKPIPYNEFSTDLRLKFTDDSWSLSSDNIELSSDELVLSAEILVEKPLNDDVRMSLLASVFKGDAKFANHYFPHLLMGNELVDYLNNAIIEGKVEQAQVLFNGPLSKFPFEKNEGIFSVDAEITHAKFRFDPAWPVINEFHTNLNFTNNSMLITGRSGYLENIDVHGVTVGIKDLSHERILEVNATFDKIDPALVSQLINKSPLKTTVGKALNSISVTEPVSGDFSLYLPLKNVEDGIAKGTVKFDKNRVSLHDPNMLFTEVNGELTYKNDVISAQNFNLLWRGLPIKLSVNAFDKGMFYDANFNIDAHWKNNNWLQQLPEALQKYGAGDLEWNGLLSLNLFREGGFTYNLDIQSNLDTISLNLPEPYYKSGDEIVKFDAQITGQTYDSTINASMGDQLKFYGVLNHQESSFSKAHLFLGSEEMLLPTKGFHITTQLEAVNVAQWQPFIFNIIKSLDAFKNAPPNNMNTGIQPEDSKTTLLAKPDKISGKIGSLFYDDYSLSDVGFNLENNEKAWMLDINSKEVRSQVTLYNDLYEKGFEVDADFIHLVKNGSKDKNIPSFLTQHTSPISSEKTVNLNQQHDELFNDDVYKKLPPMLVKCASCKIDALDLGKLSFNVRRNNQNNIVLEHFKASRDKFFLELGGVWSQIDGENKTSIQGSAEIKDLEQETERLGYTPTIKDSGLYGNFLFDWPASPYEFSIAQLNGIFSARLDDGYLIDVPDQARVFSLLSLQSLVRKLKFDFRDIFADGMFYKSIKGDFTLNKGVLYTDNLFMKGAAGDLEVKGNTDLGKELFDIRMSYKPNVTSSLPALAWIATLNPVAFLAGIAIEEVVTSQVYYEMNFELTGTMSEPIFKDVNRKTRNISVGKTTPPQIINEINAPVDVQPLNDKDGNSESKTNELPKKSAVDG